MTGRADGGEGTGESEDDDLLVGPLLGGVVVDGDTAGGDFALLLRPGDVAVAIESVLSSRHGDGGRDGRGGGGLTRRQRSRGSCRRP